MHLHQASQPKRCIQLNFLIKKNIFASNIAQLLILMSVPEFHSPVSTLGFTRVSHLLEMMTDLRNGLTVELNNDEFTTVVFRFRL